MPAEGGAELADAIVSDPPGCVKQRPERVWPVPRRVHFLAGVLEDVRPTELGLTRRYWITL
jgi:hypothetical protein